MPLFIIILALIVCVVVLFGCADEFKFATNAIYCTISIVLVLWITIAAFQQNNYKYEYINTINVMHTDTGLIKVSVIDEDKIIDLTDKGLNVQEIDDFKVQKQIELCTGGIDWGRSPEYSIVKKDHKE